MRAKQAILKKICQSLEDIPEDESPEQVSVPRSYRQKGDLPHEETVALFAERAGEYKATVRRLSQKKLQQVIKESCLREDVQDLVIPEGFPAKWLPDSINAMHDDPESPLSHEQLDEADGVITTCELAVAQTGTIFLNAGPGQGRRVLSLLPDYHICVIFESQILELIPEGFAGVEEGVRSEGHPITMISGPSATSDIELSRVEGVHGPRRLEVLIVEGRS
jgi:L-lactate dehydrogenase complex protein LldG